MKEHNKSLAYIYRISVVALALSAFYLWVEESSYRKMNEMVFALIAVLAVTAIRASYVKKPSLINDVMQFGSISILVYMLLLKI